MGQPLLEAVVWPADYQPACPSCTGATNGLQEKAARVRGLREPVVSAIAVPCGCPVDEHAAALQAGAARAARSTTGGGSDGEGQATSPSGTSGQAVPVVSMASVVARRGTSRRS